MDHRFLCSTRIVSIALSLSLRVVNPVKAEDEEEGFLRAGKTTEYDNDTIHSGTRRITVDST